MATIAKLSAAALLIATADAKATATATATVATATATKTATVATATATGTVATATATATGTATAAGSGTATATAAAAPKQPSLKGYKKALVDFFGDLPEDSKIRKAILTQTQALATATKAYNAVEGAAAIPAKAEDFDALFVKQAAAQAAYIKANPDAAATASAATATAATATAATHTATVVDTATKAATHTATVVDTATKPATHTATVVDTATVVKTATATQTKPATHTATVVDTATVVKPNAGDTATATATVVETKTATVVETKTATVVETKTATVVETKTATVVQPKTATKTATVVETKTATVVQPKTATATVVETKTATVVETATKTKTVVPAGGKLILADTAATATATVATKTATVATKTATATATATATKPATGAGSATATATATAAAAAAPVGFAELTALKVAQDALNKAVSEATQTMRGEYADIGQFYPYKDTKSGDQLTDVAEADFKAYAKLAKAEKVHDKDFATASKDAKKARDDLTTFIFTNEKLMAAYSDPLFIAEMPAMQNAGKLFTAESLEAKLEKIDEKTNKKAHADMKAFVAKVKAITKEDRKTFDTKFEEMSNTVAAFVKSSNQLDTEIKALAESITKDADVDEKVKKVSKKALAPVTHRATVRKVAASLQTLAEEKEKVDKTDLHEKKGGSGDDTDPATKEEGGSMGAVVGVIVGLVVVGLGVGYCKYTNKFCFSKEDDPKEGGDADKTVYKKEVKSKNSHKRHAKESLMPSFKVAEEES